MKLILAIILSCFGVHTIADTFEDRVHSIDEFDGETLIKFENGRIAFLQHENKFLNLDMQKIIGKKFEIQRDNKFNLKKIEEVSDSTSSDTESFYKNSYPRMKPSLIPYYSQLQSLWNGINTSFKSDTECTDKAHIWAFEEWRKFDLYSMKVFLFFTPTYIKKYRYGWWFHVAPYTYVGNSSSPQEYVLDKAYSKTPLLTDNWTNIFIKSKRKCPLNTYHGYEANKYGREHCYIVKAPMYYRLPLHVEEYERSRIEKTSFNVDEVNYSYQAFRRSTLR